MAKTNKQSRKNSNPDRPPKGDVWKVPFSQLVLVDGLNIRTDYGDLQQLCKSIEEVGIKVPLQGRRDGNTFYVTDGHRRYKAMEMLAEKGIEVIAPFIVEAKGTNEEMRIVNMVVTNDGKPLNPLELAEAVRRLVAYGWSYADIAPKFGFSQLYVSRLDLLNSAPKKFTKLIEKGKISPTQAIKIAGEGKIDEFMSQYDSGAFGDLADDGNGKRITAKNIAEKSGAVNSWKYFKNYVGTVEPDELPKEKKELFVFMYRVLNNQVSAKEMDAFFRK